MHDLDTITGLQHVLRMPAFGKNLTIDFNRDLACCVTMLHQQLSDAELRIAIVLYTVKDNFHVR